MEIETIKIISSILSLIGSGFLAFRVYGILKALSFVAWAHDHNIMQLHGPGPEIIMLTQATEQIDRAKKMGLLITGFACLVLSASLQVAILVL